MSSGHFWTRKHFPEGTVIFKQGDHASMAYIIETGKVEIYLRSKNEQQMLIETVGPNEIFGELALVDHKTRSASAVAVKDTTCKVLKQDDFDKVMERTEVFLQKLVRLLGERVRKSNETFLVS